MNKIFIFLFILFLLSIITYIFTIISVKIIIPSYYSVIGACDVNYQEKFNKLGVEKQAETRVTIENNIVTNVQIVNLNNNIGIYDPYNYVNKHEYCHLEQAINNKIATCDNITFKFLNEVECYIAQTFPNFLYKKLYYELK